MAKSGRLKAALKDHKGFDPKKEEQKKLRKKAELKKKRKAATEPEEKKAIDIAHIDDTDSSGSSDDEDEEEDDNEEVKDATKKTNGVSPFAASNAILNGTVEADDDESANDDEEDEDDIPFSDIASLDSQERGDVVPYQRLTINNHAALTASLNRIAIPLSTLPFSVHHTITAAKPTVIKDIDDDLSRELAFYAQSLAAVKIARKQLKAEGVPFTRPTDYFAEMVKSEEHMGRVRQRLVDDAAGKKAAAEARRQRDLKKFGKAVQVAKLQERDKSKRDTIEKINTLKRKRSNALPSAENEGDLFDVALEDEVKRPRTSSGAKDKSKDRDPKRNSKRAKKDEKYGFGGKKRFSKSGDAQSTSDMRDFSAKKMKQGAGRFAGATPKKRLGKARRKTHQ